MNKKELTKAEALVLITPVVDDEVSIEERHAFFKYISTDSGTRRKYESARNLKVLIRTRFQRTPAPDSLLRKVRNFIRNAGNSDQQNGRGLPVYDIPTGGPAGYGAAVNPGGREPEGMRELKLIS